MYVSNRPSRGTFCPPIETVLFLFGRLIGLDSRIPGEIGGLVLAVVCDNVPLRRVGQ
jgi:hypothetical protein